MNDPRNTAPYEQDAELLHNAIYEIAHENKEDCPGLLMLLDAMYDDMESHVYSIAKKLAKAEADDAAVHYGLEHQRPAAEHSGRLLLQGA